MFGFITDSIENVLNVGDSLLDGELPSKRQVAELIADGMSVVAIAGSTGVAVDVIRDMMED